MDPAIYAMSAVAALGLAGLRREQGRLARQEYLASVRPLLAELPAIESSRLEHVRFGAPRHNSVDVATGSLYLNEEANVLQLSVPFRNVGRGPAVVRRVGIDPRGMGSVLASRAIVPVGAQARVNVSLVIVSPAQRERMATQSFTVDLEYADATATQLLVSRAHVHRFGAEGCFVGPIDVLRRGESEPFLTASPIKAI